MNNENRQQKWAVLLDDCEKLSKGEPVTVEVVTFHAMHGGGYWEPNIEREIEVSEIEEIAPNMLIVRSGDTDYYMYNYNLSGCNVCFPTNKFWAVDTELKIGKQIRFTRAIRENLYKPEAFMTNPVFKTQVIHPNLLIAWCKDRELGNDIGYLIDTADFCFSNAPTKNYFWVYDLWIPTSGESTGKITVDLAGRRFSTYVKFIPKNVTALGNWSLIEGDDGNFYICQYPFENLRS